MFRSIQLYKEHDEDPVKWQLLKFFRSSFVIIKQDSCYNTEHLKPEIIVIYIYISTTLSRCFMEAGGYFSVQKPPKSHCYPIL